MRRGAVTAGVVGFLASPQVRARPHRLYSALRRFEPVHESPFGLWILSRHEEVSACLRNPAMSSDERRADQEWLFNRPAVKLLMRARPMQHGDGASWGLMERMMLFVDPPDHTRLRSLVNKAFTPRAVSALEPRVVELVAEMLDRLAPRGRAELMGEFAYPLPARVIGEMLGVPPEGQELIVRHAPAVASRIDPSPMRGADEMAAADHAAAELTAYVESLIDSRRRCPGTDLLSALMAAEEQGDRLTHDELLSTVILLLIAGHETTANLIGNGVLALMQSPSQSGALLSDPARAVEELLRYDGPIQMTERVTLEEVELGRRRIPARRIVILLLAAANRDRDVFPDPDRLDLTRHPNPHGAFSSGAHFCHGSPLARLEARLALPAIVERLGGGRADRLSLAGPAPRRNSFTIRGLKSLPLTWAA